MGPGRRSEAEGSHPAAPGSSPVPEDLAVAIAPEGGPLQGQFMGVLVLQPRWRLGGQVVSNPARIAIVVVCAITLFYLVITLARSVAEGG